MPISSTNFCITDITLFSSKVLRFSEDGVGKLYVAYYIRKYYGEFGDFCMNLLTRVIVTLPAILTVTINWCIIFSLIYARINKHITNIEFISC